MVSASLGKEKADATVCDVPTESGASTSNELLLKKKNMQELMVSPEQSWRQISIIVSRFLARFLTGLIILYY